MKINSNTIGLNDTLLINQWTNTMNKYYFFLNKMNNREMHCMREKYEKVYELLFELFLQ